MLADVQQIEDAHCSRVCIARVFQVRGCLPTRIRQQPIAPPGSAAVRRPRATLVIEHWYSGRRLGRHCNIQGAISIEVARRQG
jgi:hypothetical protein